MWRNEEDEVDVILDSSVDLSWRDDSPKIYFMVFSN